MADREQASQQSWEGELFRLLVENVKDYAIFVMDSEGRVRSWNPGAERLLGYSEGEIIGQPAALFFTPEDIQGGVPQREMGMAVETGRGEDERWHVRKDGSRFFSGGTITPLWDEGRKLRGFAKIMRDRTAQKHSDDALKDALNSAKKAEEERREIETRFTSLVKDIKDHAIFTMDLDGRITSWNVEAERILGYSEAEILEKTFSVIFTPEDLQVGMPGQELCKARETGRADDERWHVRKGGERFWASGIVTPTHDASGKHTGFSKILRDMTERKQAEKLLQQADRRKSEFLATLAHELRSPLAPIHTSLQIMKMPGVAAVTVERTREMMERQVQQLVRLVDDLLDVSRIDRGKIELRKERVELAAVVARAVETAQPLLDAQGHELNISLPVESLPLEADPVRLAQIVGNLLTNAAKYMEPNGRIWLAAQRDGGEAVLRVRDTGIGIAPDMLSKVFDLFVQVDHAATRSRGGLGIGLTLVKNLVEMHQGRVEAHSAGLGKGSEFVVRLPLSCQERAKPKGLDSAEQRGNTSLPGHRLLLVDDSTDTAESLAMLLRLQGHEVQVAHDGPAALEMLKGFRPEMVILDIKMPGMDGYEVARWVRQMPGMENVRLAALTGWGQPEDKRRSKEAGFDHHLVKPVEPAALEKLLAELLLTPA